MKLSGIKRICIMFCVNHILAGTRFFDVKRKLLRSVGFSIGERTKVVGPISCTAKLNIGSDCWIGRNFTVEGNGEVTIGDRCDIAPGVMLATGGHAIGGPDRRAGAGQSYTIRVGSGTWIGARATVVKSVTIGTGCVIAACACVTSDVSDHCLVGGVPAKVIRELDHGIRENS